MFDGSPKNLAALTDAHQRMIAALEILDNASAPNDIACHLDLAIARLEEAVSVGVPDIRTIALEVETIANSPARTRAVDCVWAEA